MKAKKVLQLLTRLHEVEGVMGEPGVHANQAQYRELAREHSYLSEVKHIWDDIQKSKKEISENEALIRSEQDFELTEMLREDIARHEQEIVHLEAKLENLLVPPDPDDHRNTILEIRAGTGGEEAALFVADCIRMYKMFSDKMGWRCEQLSCSESDMGGYKEYVMVMSGPNVYRCMKHEGGTHRVQRVPKTEAQGRVHTSAITVAVLLEPDELHDVVIDEKELRIDTFRSSGAGGQHVNTTDSAVRMTHLPTGIVAECQDERSQHKNREKAMRILKAKIADAERLKQEMEIASNRASQVGSGDRSERIRTYNFSQNRVTDHRIEMTKYNLDQVMAGDLEDFVNALVAHYHQEKLNAS
jgi:peptide chain release factor 1